MSCNKDVCEKLDKLIGAVKSLVTLQTETNELLAKMAECTCGDCEDDCFAALLTDDCGQGDCKILNVDAAADRMSDESLQEFVMELRLAGDSATANPDCAPLTVSLAGETVNVERTLTGPAITNFADIINNSWGSYGFAAQPCGNVSFDQEIAVKGPDCFSWEIKITPNAGGYAYMLGYNHVTGEYYREETLPSGTPITPSNIDSSTTADGNYYLARNCNDCDF